jgi:hypothetical protein
VTRVPLTPSTWALLDGDGAVAEVAQREFETRGAAALQGSPLFRLEISERAAPVTSGSVLGPAREVEAGVALRLERMDMDLVLRDGPELDATLHIGRRGPPFHLPKLVVPYFERTAMTWAECQAYNAALLLEALCLLSRRVAVLHASAVERAGKVVAFTSIGGVGKTTTACALVAQHDFRHLSDDITLLDEDGALFRSLRKMMVYPYNDPSVMPRLDAAVTATGLRSRLLWELDSRLHLGRRRRRLTAGALFGQARVAEQGQLDSVVFLQRSVRPGIKLSEISPEELARRASPILELEFASFFSLVRHAEALRGSASPLSISAAGPANELLLQSAFRSARKTLVAELGPDSTPNQLAALVAQ